MPPVRLPDDAELPLLRARVGELPKRALAVGDPARAARAAESLDDARQLSANREYHLFTGSYRGEPVVVASHGVGAAGAAVCFEELCRAGVTRIIRSGTAGGMQPDILDGAVVVATGAIRADGVSHQLVPTEFPALATPRLTLALEEAAGRSGLEVRSGVVVTGDMFYPSDVITGVDLQMWQRAGAVAVEMEAAALFVIAALHGVEAAGIFAIDGNPLAKQDESMDGYDPYREIVTRAVDVALDSALEVLVS